MFATRAAATVPLEIFDPLSEVSADPSPVCVPLNVPPVIVPVNVGEALSTTFPVPVEVVVPVPPRTTASIPADTFPASRFVMPDPAPVRVVAATVAAVTVPVSVGETLSTTLPVPVDVVVPVPPCTTGSTPAEIFPASNAVSAAPEPANDVAETAPVPELKVYAADPAKTPLALYCTWVLAPPADALGQLVPVD